MCATIFLIVSIVSICQYLYRHQKSPKYIEIYSKINYLTINLDTEVDKKTIEYKTRKKKVKIGISVTEKYQAGLLKCISLLIPRNSDKCKIVIQIHHINNIEHTTRGLTINERGFNTIFDMMVKKLIGFYNLDPEDVDTKARIEKTKEVFLEKYQVICKEHKLTFYP